MLNATIRRRHRRDVVLLTAFLKQIVISLCCSAGIQFFFLLFLISLLLLIFSCLAFDLATKYKMFCVPSDHFGIFSLSFCVRAYEKSRHCHRHEFRIVVFFRTALCK